MIAKISAVARFWYHFFVGDDWTVAVGVVLALAATAALHHINVAAWCVMPVAVVTLLATTTSRAAHERGRRGSPQDRRR